MLSFPENTILDQLLRLEGMPIPADFRRAFAPAVCCLYEWQTYWLELPGVERLRVGGQESEPDHGDWFQLCFKNELGLARIQPFTSGRPLGPGLVVEVLSPKFNQPAIHLEFYQTLLADLFRRAVRLPFTINAKTERSVLEALRPPTPLFTLYYLNQYAAELEAALAVILATPHRLLTDEEALVRLEAVRQVDADVLLDVLHSPARWVKAGGHPLSSRLGGYVPQHVLQRLPEETFDTPENRFVLHFLGQLINAADDLTAQPWWVNVAAERCRKILQTRSLLQQTSQHPMFEEVGEQHLLPLHSQVLLRRDGYRQMLTLWQQFHQARRPLFEPLRKAMELRNVADLYEFWVFFALAEQIGELFGIAPSLELKTSDPHGLMWNSEAHFGQQGTLVFNHSFQRNWTHFHSYSTALRPDFTWVVEGKPRCVLDAKFSFMLVEFESGEEEGEIRTVRQPKLENLYKMHTYRDALKVRSAVILYPGSEAIFYDCEGGRMNQICLRNILLDGWEGIGALPLQPGSLSIPEDKQS
jgi:uncharacterized protein